MKREILGKSWVYRHTLAAFTLGFAIAAFSTIVAKLAWLHKISWFFAVPIMAAMVLVGARLLYISVRAENDADWTCLKCGYTNNIRRSKYCPKCGSEMVAVLRQTLRCPNGHKVSEFDKYCPKCGAKIEVERL